MNTSSPTTSRLRTGLVTVTVLGGVLGTGLVAAATTSSQADGPGRADHARVLRFGVRFSPFDVIDVPPLQRHDGDYAPGDYVVFSDVLVDRAGRRAGTEAGTGMITRVDRSGVQIHYAVAIRLRGGQVTGSGLGTPDPRKHLAVTGGTGRFTGARGSIRLVENGDGTGRLAITLR